MPGALEHLRAALADLDARGLLRDDEPPLNTEYLDACSNDYLGFAALPVTAPGTSGGAGASRLVAGERQVHRDAETALASWVGAEAALLFTSGYAANLGAIAALAQPGDLVVSDELNHASIIDGCRLSRATIHVTPHARADQVEAVLRSAPTGGRRWIVTESHFSMDGDVADLRALRDVADRWGAALIVDEAHAMGVFGPGGAGLCRELGVQPDVLIGTLGKAVGLQGAFVAGSRDLRRWLWNRARSFVFSTGLSPAIAAEVVVRVDRVRQADPARARLREIWTRVRGELERAGADVRGVGPILPWVLGGADRAMRASRLLRDHRVAVPAIRPPTVPPGTARLRLTARASLTEGEVDTLVSALRTVADAILRFT